MDVVLEQRTFSEVKRLCCAGQRDGLALLGEGIEELRTERCMFFMRYRSPEHWLDFHRAHFGPIHHAFRQLDAAGQQHLADEVTDWLTASNTATDGTLVLACEYLEIVVTRR